MYRYTAVQITEPPPRILKGYDYYYIVAEEGRELGVTTNQRRRRN